MTNASNSDSRLDLDLDPAYAPPMSNGEVVFEAPWQGRVFAMAVALHEAGLFEWDEFQQQLINAVGQWDASNDEGEYPYYELFLQAFTELLTSRDIFPQSALDQRMIEFSARPHDHDHGHDHTKH